ncbi:MAG TPA: cytochrome c [Acetobacteraceae bacterium]|nr:cytochrome c [Acetobacteraceae bacterium]
MISRRIGSSLAAAALVVVLSAGAAAQTAAPDPQNFSQIAHGRYVAVLGDCAACHTDPGGRPFAGGLAIETPFGNVVGANITPDRKTGIGGWTDAQFIRAVTQGIAPGGVRLYPAMPYPAYTKMTRQDLIALKAYLNTVNPVHNRVHSDALPFPFNIRLGMAVWNRLFFRPGTFKPDPHQSADWNRGAYLVEGPGHCGTCHTPKNFLGADRNGQFLRGFSVQGWFAPNITGNEHVGVGSWSVQDIVSYLKTGANAHAIASGPMADEVEDSSSHMTTADLRAIAVFLKDQPAGNNPPSQPMPASDPIMQAGAAIYTDECAACHTEQGSGVARLFPTLKGSPLVQSAEPTSLIHVVLEGSRAVATDAAPTAPAMPPFGWKLSDRQVADVVTYIRNAWGNHASPVSTGDVRAARRTLASTAP